MLTDPVWRLGIFIAVFAVLAAVEIAAPARTMLSTRARRWSTNLALFALDVALLRLLFPVAAVAAALFAQKAGWGLFNLVDLPGVVEGIVAFLLLDFAVWAQHVAFHRSPLFWRVHAVHHAARDLDVTAGVRFHPIEAVLSMVFKIAVVALLGAPPEAVFVFEVVLNAGALFSHANITMPARLEPWLRLIVVTPDMHRTHHSTIPSETNTNYGFFLSIWDRIFGVYTDEPSQGRAGLVIGLAEHNHEGPDRLDWSLLLPFRAKRDQSETNA